MKTWKYFEYEQCPQCGKDLEVLTEPGGDVCDGDAIECVGCDFNSRVSVDEGKIWVQDV